MNEMPDRVQTWNQIRVVKVTLSTHVLHILQNGHAGRKAYIEVKKEIPTVAQGTVRLITRYQSLL